MFDALRKRLPWRGQLEIAGRDYSKPVGVPITVGSEGHALPQWELALSLIDRDAQITAMNQHFDAFAKEGAGRSLLVIVPGTTSDCQRYFPARCTKWDFREKTGENWAYYGALKWGGSLPLVIKEISRKFGYKDIEDIDSLNKILKNHPRYICFSHMVGSHDNTETIIEWVNIFAEARLVPHPTRFLIAFLCLQRRVYEQSQRFEELTKDWRATNRPHVVVLPELGRITQEDLQSWPGTAQGYDVSIELGDVDIGGVFKGEEQPLFLRDVAEKLRNVLEPQFKGPKVEGR